MITTALNDQQQQGLTDLLLLGMYADAHLSAFEDARLERLLDAMAFSSDHARRLFVDAAILRVRRMGQDAGARLKLMTDVAAMFPRAEKRQEICRALEELLAGDGTLTPAEQSYLIKVQQAFR